MKLHTYLNYGGNCKEGFSFYEKHLGGKITMIMTHGEMTGAKDVPPEVAKTVLHARLELDETAIMASDVPQERFQPMRRAYLSLIVFAEIEAGGSKEPPSYTMQMQRMRI